MLTLVVAGLLRRLVKDVIPYKLQCVMLTQVVLAQLAEVTDHLGAIDQKIGIYEDVVLGAGLDLERAPGS